jgi:hypothetical protein
LVVDGTQCLSWLTVVVVLLQLSESGFRFFSAGFKNDAGITVWLAGHFRPQSGFDRLWTLMNFELAL